MPQCLAWGVNADLTDHLADVQDAKFASLINGQGDIPRKDALANCSLNETKLACRFSFVCWFNATRPYFIYFVANSTGCMCRDPTMTCSEYCEPASEQKMGRFFASLVLLSCPTRLFFSTEWPSVVFNGPWSAVSFTVDGSEQKKSVLPTRTFPGLLN